MIILKIYYHMNAIFKKILYKIIYGKRIKFGKNVTFRKGFSLIIEKNAIVEIGDGVFFNNNCSINAMSKVKIESNCLFGENVKIYDHNHIFKYKNKLIKNQGYKTGEIIIGENSWIGSNCVILKNVNIGKNCVIQAMSLINQNIEDSIIFRKNNTKELINFCE